MCKLERMLIALSAVLALVSATEAKEDPPVVATKYGLLEGKKVSVKGTSKPVYNYLAIPFAKPPVGPLRFTAPQAAEAWTGTRQATNLAPGCQQDTKALEAFKNLMMFDVMPSSMSEDCLYLNVHTPVGPKDRNKRLSVMVWIHGGGFTFGSTDFYDGSSLAAYEDVVLVVIQYRLGIFGFLSTGDEHLRGNWGLLDQVAALKWVQENIENFGGDPGSVTIFGESAGAMSVSFHVVSPLSSGLFHKAISESGTALINFGSNLGPKSLAQMVANMTGCDTDHSWEIADCLKKKSAEELLNINSTEISFFPVVDGVFLPRDIEQLLAAKEVNSVPYLLGINNQEFGWLLPKMMLPPGWEEGMDRETAEPIYKSLKLFEENQLQQVIDEYMGDTQDRIEIRDLQLELLGDIFMLVPTIRTARFHRDAGNPVFLYEFQHRPSIYGTSRPEFVKSDHGDEVGFVFGTPFWEKDVSLFGNITEEELVLSRTVMSYWANFAKNGNPNGEELKFWPVYDQNEDYMQLNLKLQVGRKLKEHRMKFFTETLKLKGGKKSEQYAKDKGHQRSEL
ncbi:fatty acyl-CoA hydrolase precursor, medium chain-like [Heterodontus francisci]|uniref:fatty acyl-CoA hydrolase precursor, medium chain-like n=1 Tax=Heterodontus francisci TaxID=7792 RepID=UPI00355B9B98